MAGQGALAALLAALLALPASCDLPRDPRRTRDRIMGETLAVAVVAPALTPAEERALEVLARHLGAGLALVPGDIHASLDALDHGGLEVVVGGIPKDSPLAGEAAASSPIGREEFVMLLRRGENAMLLAANRAVGEASEAAP